MTSSEVSMRQRRAAGTLRTWLGLVLGFSLLGVTLPAWAQPLNWNQPAATLLLPYFEIDLANANGATTIFSINNATATAILAHVVVYSDLAVPVLTFNVYLTGFDVQEVDLGQVVRSGLLPVTASNNQDPQDTISPKGPMSQDITYPGCTGQLPYPSPALLPAQVQALQAALTGGFSALAGGCCGFSHGDNKARGYLTVDTATFCTLDVHSSPGYFISGGLGSASNQNVLYGDYFAINPAAGVGRGHELVHILAQPGVGVLEPTPTTTATTTPGAYTFYGRYNSWSAADNRVPLATVFAARFRNGGIVQNLQAPSAGSAPGTVADPVFTRPTELEVWRDSKVSQAPFPCGTLPSWVPLNQEELVVFDDKENPAIPAGLKPFPLATQRVQIGGPALPQPFSTGWAYLNLNTTVAGSPPGQGDTLAAQAWVTVVESAGGSIGGAGASGRFTTGYHALPMDSGEAVKHFLIH